MRRSHEIVEVFADVVARVAEGLTITTTDSKGRETAKDCPPVHYAFGSSKTVKAKLEELSKNPAGQARKLPMIALFTPVLEQRGNTDYYTTAKVNLIIACSTSGEWSNEQRCVRSFQNVLRPIYRKFLEELESDARVDFGYGDTLPHQYSENYSYGKYGAYASDGTAVSEPIDAIDIRNLEIKIKPLSCR